MVNNIEQQPNMEEIRALLSPYMDDEVTHAERELVEHALLTTPELQEELTLMRRMVTMLAEMPVVAAPRPFTLTDADVTPVAAPASKKRVWWQAWPAWAGGLAMLTATLVCVLAAGGMFFTGALGGSSMAPAEVAMQTEKVARVEAEIAPGATAPEHIPADAPVAEIVEDMPEEAKSDAVISAAPAQEQNNGAEIEDMDLGEAAEEAVQEEADAIDDAERTLDFAEDETLAPVQENEESAFAGEAATEQNSGVSAAESQAAPEAAKSMEKEEVVASSPPAPAKPEDSAADKASTSGEDETRQKEDQEQLELEPAPSVEEEKQQAKEMPLEQEQRQAHPENIEATTIPTEIPLPTKSYESKLSALPENTQPPSPTLLPAKPTETQPVAAAQSPQWITGLILLMSIAVVAIAGILIWLLIKNRSV